MSVEYRVRGVTVSRNGERVALCVNERAETVAPIGVTVIGHASVHERLLLTVGEAVELSDALLETIHRVRTRGGK